ncbi:MAG: hypothetical protein HOV96_28100 [Nonomuraea sp.]|nr:hypothetical protein [Nonomuraea sp.]NUP60747.1 hypothetical protein [Nonomuraea sp.]NUP81406.1 hypothetical protein [Nonomuraea sp.]NUS01641.1 hypothetical protein [Nonomuraea sp.]NUT40337.1 hypothetical protein [Thermoactinospora sp.]
MRTLLAGGAAAAVLLTSGVAHATTAHPAYKKPKIFGTSFQPDPRHDFTKGIHSRHNGILRGWITTIRGTTAEYEPIKWKKAKYTEGYFVGPPEGDVTAYASPIAKNVVFLSAYGCKPAMTAMTVDRNNGLGNKRCSRSVLLKRHAKQGHPSLITVYQGKIVQVQEIYTP